MSKNDGGSAMTLDLESLRDLLWEIDNQVVTHGIGYREVITRTERVVSEVIAELTARRARDAEVEALLNRASDLCLGVVKRDEHAAHNSANLRNDIDKHLQGVRLAAAASSKQ